jgi:hypothetical protein
MTSDATSCAIQVDGSLNPRFKGGDTDVDLVCVANCPSCLARVVGSTSPLGTIDQCTGQFAFAMQGTIGPSGNCILPHADPGEACFFLAHVTSTNRQQCNSNTGPAGPDPIGTAPCSGAFCN